LGDQFNREGSILPPHNLGVKTNWPGRYPRAGERPRGDKDLN
jgi:hypothetical protein